MLKHLTKTSLTPLVTLTVQSYLHTRVPVFFRSPIKAHDYHSSQSKSSWQSNVKPTLKRYIHTDKATDEPAYAPSLLQALNEEQFDKAQALLKQGIGVYSLDNEDNSILHIAARKNYWQLIADMLASGIYIDVKNKIGQTPLQVAIEYGSEKFITTLIQGSTLSDNQKERLQLICFASMQAIISQQEQRLHSANVMLNTCVLLDEIDTPCSFFESKLDQLFNLSGKNRLELERDILKQAIKLIKKYTGDDDEHLVIAYSNLAEVSIHLSRYHKDIVGLEYFSQGLNYFNEAIKLSEKLWGTENSKTRAIKEETTAAENELRETFFDLRQPDENDDNNTKPSKGCF